MIKAILSAILLIAISISAFAQTKTDPCANVCKTFDANCITCRTTIAKMDLKNSAKITQEIPYQNTALPVAMQNTQPKIVPLSPTDAAGTTTELIPLTADTEQDVSAQTDNSKPQEKTTHINIFSP